MKSEYLIVHKSALPECYEKVVEARELLRRGAAREVSEAVKIVGISRSTFYKYKDLVFTPGESASCRRAIFSMLLSHERGVLGRVLNSLSDMGANVLTIMQNPPMGERANVVISVDISDLDRSIEETVTRLSEMHGVERAGLLDME